MQDLAMNYLVAHLTRKPPLKVIKKVDIKCVFLDSKFLHNYILKIQ